MRDLSDIAAINEDRSLILAAQRASNVAEHSADRFTVAEQQRRHGERVEARQRANGR